MPQDDEPDTMATTPARDDVSTQTGEEIAVAPESDSVAIEHDDGLLVLSSQEAHSLRAKLGVALGELRVQQQTGAE